METKKKPGRKSTVSAPGPDQTPEHWRTGRNRIEKSELIRNALLQAAAEVVGELGYAEASITRITQKAGVAQGTFYNYFETRQDILDELLPALGAKMQRHVKDCALGGHNFAELEERGFLGFFSFLEQEPHFFRILNEAESFAPVGHKSHFDSVVKQYTHFLQHSQKAGEFSNYESKEFEVIVFMLMAARSYLAMRYFYDDTKKPGLPAWVTETYMKFVRYGLEGVPQSGEAKPSAGKKKTRS
ncbi:transcriptional regulator, TetR family [Collimonas sp. OK607]|uniref:TetR/AcrR family transcriptional regulator n=1 Tax=Collimonas sp. OK607 TaxID=1798194 RepID=UPI0008E7DF6A|nr:TetR/AcrR family transcriptional regulator [Collimonas sp. OK607]SFB01576.1 transcriptional regulator, TetR family [Collimonas sp. OK607]